MIISGSANDWENHQRREISTFIIQNTNGFSGASVDRLARTCMPLYPGSMLFNQIAVVDSEFLSGLDAFENPRIQSLDAVYEALGIDAALTADSLLVDCQHWWEGIQSVLQGEIENYCERNTGHRNVVVLSSRYNAQIKSICNKLSVNCRVINPRWWCAASLLCLYRKSEHVVFVDTARSLDAAMTGVSCSLVVGDAFSENPVFPALFASLSHLSCCSLNLPRRLVANPMPNTASILIVENNHEALRCAMDQSCEAELADGCRDVYQYSDPVIRTGVFWQQLWKRKVANINVSARRKTRKLVEDPRAFFNDSRLPGSGAIAAIFSESRVS